MTTMSVALLALPADIYWAKLAGWDLPGKSEQTMNAKVYGVYFRIGLSSKSHPCDLYIFSVAVECS